MFFLRVRGFVPVDGNGGEMAARSSVGRRTAAGKGKKAAATPAGLQKLSRTADKTLEDSGDEIAAVLRRKAIQGSVSCAMLLVKLAEHEKAEDSTAGVKKFRESAADYWAAACKKGNAEPSLEGAAKASGESREAELGQGAAAGCEGSPTPAKSRRRSTKPAAERETAAEDGLSTGRHDKGRDGDEAHKIG